MHIHDCQNHVTCVSSSDTSRFNLFKCLFTNVMRVWKKERPKVQNQESKLSVCKTSQEIVWCALAFFTTFSLSGAWSKRVSKASRSVSVKYDMIAHLQGGIRKQIQSNFILRFSTSHQLCTFHNNKVSKFVQVHFRKALFSNSATLHCYSNHLIFFLSI